MKKRKNRSHRQVGFGRCRCCGDQDMLDETRRCSSCVSEGVIKSSQVADEDDDDGSEGKLARV